MRISELPFLRNYWYPVLRTEDLADKPVGVRLFGEEWVAWRHDGEVGMVGAVCPHRGGRIANGWVDGGRVVCPYHGWQYDGVGRCVHMPQLTDGTPIPSRAVLAAANTAERYGVVWACVGEEPYELPVWPEAEEGGWRLFVEFFEVFNCSALRIIDNNIDISHPAFVHRNTFGDPAQAAMLASRVEATDHGLVAQFHRSTPGVGKQTGASDDETVRFERTSELEVLAPLTTHLRLLYPDAPDYAFFGSATPVDDEHSIYMRLTALAGTEDQQPYAPFHEFGTRVKEEDRVILEATPVDFPIELTSEIHLRTDRTTIEYRRYLSRLAGLSRPSGGLVALGGASASTG